jgi:diguanylate cyclase (GGDEF)-like protein/PAS domain S-box-containing protein
MTQRSTPARKAAPAPAAQIAAERQADLAEQRLRAAVEALPEGIVFLDAEGRYILWNQRYAEIYKRSADLFEVGAKLEDTLRVGIARGDYPDAIGREEEWLAQRLSLMANPGQRHEQRLADGRWIMIEERKTADGGTIGIRVDITELKQALAELGETRGFLDAVVENMPAMVLVTDPTTGKILMLNRAGETVLGYERDSLVGRTYAEVFPPDQAERLAAHDRALMSSGGAPAVEEQQISHKDGSPRLLRMKKMLIRDADGKPQYLVAVCEDTTERRRNEARIAHMARHDALTGLPNRVLFHDRLTRALTRAGRDDQVAVLCIDLDRFKTVNDTLGHPVGDVLLKLVSDRLSACIREGDTVARLGGDEFAVIQHRLDTTDAAGLLAERIVETLGQPFEVQGHQVVTGASVGIAISPADGTEPEELLKKADMALYRAKAEGRGAYHYFESGMDDRLQARRLLELDMRRALVDGEFELFYQPLLNLAENRITGCEALLRWRHPERGLVLPGEFIGLAEEIGLIGPLGEWVMRRACQEAAGWPSDMKVAVNLSPIQFRSKALVATVVSALANSGLPASRLELEITESVLLHDSDSNIKVLHELRALGVRIAMDDFGTGYSSLSYLRSFPFDKIKIDRSFVSDLTDHGDALAIVKAVASLGASLGIVTTAEGVETQDQFDRLRQEGCTEVQGFLVSRPCDAATLKALIAEPLKRRA